MGPGKFAAWKAGAFTMENLFGRKRDPRWGTMRYERSLRDVVGAGHARKRLERVLADRRELRSLGAAASLKVQRLQQLRSLSDQSITQLIGEIRSAKTIPKPEYHSHLHGKEFDANTVEQYLRAFRAHLERQDLRIFTYLRARNRTPFWELVAPDTGASVPYNEQRRAVWSFFRPGRPAMRMERYQADWIEVRRTDSGWIFDEDWQWEP